MAPGAGLQRTAGVVSTYLSAQTTFWRPTDQAS